MKKRQTKKRPIKKPDWVSVKIPQEAYDTAQKLLEGAVRNGWSQAHRPTLGTVIQDALEARLEDTTTKDR